MLKDQSRAFVAFLRLNRGMSPNTIRAYDTDVTQCLEFIATARGVKPSQVSVSDFNADHIRDFLGALHHRGLTAASAARRLAALRTFARVMTTSSTVHALWFLLFMTTAFRLPMTCP